MKNISRKTKESYLANQQALHVCLLIFTSPAPSSLLSSPLSSPKHHPKYSTIILPVESLFFFFLFLERGFGILGGFQVEGGGGAGLFSFLCFRLINLSPTPLRYMFT